MGSVAVAKLIELSHSIEAGMTTYPGLPGPVLSDFLSREASRTNYAPGTTFQIGRVEIVANTGTYLDAPFHRFAEGADVAGLPLERLADLDGIVVDAIARRSRALGPDLFEGQPLRDRAVLIRTGWDIHWRTPRYGEGHPYLTCSAAERLSAAAPALVGIDSLNIDDTGDSTRPAHTRLLEAGIPIVEHLCGLEALPASGFRVHCVPPPFRGLGSFPVRAYAVIG